MHLSQALTRLATDEDPAAMAVLYEHLAGAIRRLATRITGDAQLGEECIVDVVLSAARAARTWRAHSADPEQDARRWILGIAATTARSKARARRRARAREASAAAGMAWAEDAAPEHGLLAQERRAVLQEAVAHLPPPYAAAVTARYVAGLEVKDAASRLGIPEATVKTRVFRGLALLKRRLATWRHSLAVVLLRPASRHPTGMDHAPRQPHHLPADAVCGAGRSWLSPIACTGGVGATAVLSVLLATAAPPAGVRASATAHPSPAPTVRLVASATVWSASAPRGAVGVPVVATAAIRSAPAGGGAVPVEATASIQLSPDVFRHPVRVSVVLQSTLTTSPSSPRSPPACPSPLVPRSF